MTPGDGSCLGETVKRSDANFTLRLHLQLRAFTHLNISHQQHTTSTRELNCNPSYT